MRFVIDAPQYPKNKNPYKNFKTPCVKDIPKKLSPIHKKVQFTSALLTKIVSSLNLP